MWKRLTSLLEKYRELIAYGISGLATTLLNIVAYNVLAHALGIHYLVSNALAWVVAFLFAYYSNSSWVFKYPVFGKGSMARFVKFLGSRVFTGVLDMVCMWVMVDMMHLGDSFSKVVVNVIVIILNYVMSKWLIFKGD